MHALGGPLFERVFAKQFERNQFLDEPVGPSPGNLFAPVAEGDGTTGNWRRRLRRRRSSGLARADDVAPIAPG
jgi:hypothetical protein